MQTFLPYSDFLKSAHVLDNKRLGKQRVEALQILQTLVGVTKGWQNHPAVNMWRGNEYQLTMYGFAICKVWTDKGFKDTCRDKMSKLFFSKFKGFSEAPSWLGNKAFHISHQSNLVRKDPDFYRSIFPDVSDDLPYIWPK